ncbi:MAG: benzoate-CoA ligase family protein, partial [Terriglobia bacterium]
MGDPTLSLPAQFNVATYFIDRHLAQGRADALALLYEDKQFTYRQVAEQVNRAANALARAGIGPQDRVLLLLVDSPAFVAAFWGAIKLGAVPIPANTLLTPDDYEFLLRDSGARGLLVQDSLVEKVAPVLGRLSELKTVWVAGQAKSGYKSFEADLAQSAPEAAAAPTHRDAPAFWLYTSGSTGRPKAAIHLHHDMVYCLETFAKQVLEISPADRTFSASKLFFAYGLGNALYFPFGVGAATLLLAERPSAEKIFEVIRHYQPTIFFAVPTLYAAMLQLPDAAKADLGSVRLAVSAGEALPTPLYERFRERFGLAILDGIGSTEMLHMFISNWPGDIVPGSSG